MIQRASERSVPEGADRDDIRRRYEDLLSTATRLAKRENGATTLG